MIRSLAAAAFLVAAEARPQEIQPPEETVRQMKVPEGFSVKLFAGEPQVVQPVAFCLDDRGRVWVAEMLSYPKWEPKDRIVILEDTDGDGTADKRTVFCEGLTYVTGLEVGFGGVWVTAPPRMLFIPDRDGDDKPDGPPEVLLDGFGLQGGHNIVNGFTWGPDGWLYAGHGRTSPGDIGKPGTPLELRTHFDGGVWRYHPTRRVFEAWCDGTTNPWGVAFDDYGQMFISTCVDPHLFQAIQGAHYEPWRGRPSSLYAFGRIATIADHLHWRGTRIDQSRGGTPEQLEVGGGHAHAGAMVYLGDSFPESYRGTFFLNNIHGHRVNNDTLERHGSGYVARHRPDFMISGDRMEMGVGVQYGPDGSVYVSDWYDRGECHTRNPEFRTGRIYKIAYGSPAPVRPDLARRSDEDLVRLQLHRNEWYVTHARRLLQERGAGSKPAVRQALLEMLNGNPDVTRKLRALWALHALGALEPEIRRGLLVHPQEHLRAWAIQLEAEVGVVPPAVRGKFAQMAESDPSPLVRLYLACACQRLSVAERWDIVKRLAGHAEDATDQNLPLMIWYAAEPTAAADLSHSIEFIRTAKIPLLREYMSRRLAALTP